MSSSVGILSIDKDVNASRMLVVWEARQDEELVEFRQIVMLPIVDMVLVCCLSYRSIAVVTHHSHCR